MKTSIRTFDDLVAERVRLQAVLAGQGDLIKQDVVALKQELKPIKTVLGFAGKFVSKDKKNPLLNAGVDILGDVLLKNFLFAKSGFITKWIAPYLIKNFSSNLLSQNQSHLVGAIGEKIKGFLKRTN